LNEIVSSCTRAAIAVTKTFLVRHMPAILLRHVAKSKMHSVIQYAPKVPLAAGMGSILLPRGDDKRPSSVPDYLGMWRVPRRLGDLALCCTVPPEVPWHGVPKTAEHRLQAARQVQAIATQLCASHGVQISVRGTLPNEPVVVVANHVSYVDTLVLPALFPTTCVAKKEVATWPGIGALARRLGTVFVERGNPISGAVALRQSMRALAAGVNIVAFPEGTTTPGDRLLPFHRGIFGIALHSNVAVLPVTLVYDDPGVAWVGEDPFLSHYLTRVASARKTGVTVHLGPLMSPQMYSCARSMAKTAQQLIAKTLRRSLP
jgi:lyso-ornithine lipid O-acyltransferase